MIATLLLTLFPLLASVPFVRGQQAGYFVLNATVPSPATSSTGCIILGQLTIATTTIIEALNPICPSTAGEYASSPLTAVNISWPFSNNGDSYSSSIAIYAGITHADGNESPDEESGQTNPYQAKATCVMQLTEDQVQYLLGRSLTWNNNLNELWDNTQNGFVMNGTEGGLLRCANASSLLPADLWLPDPYAYAASDETWKVAMTIPSSDSKFISTSTSASSMASLVSAVSASAPDSMTTDSASSSTSSALIAVATATPSTSTSDSMSTLTSASTSTVNSTSASSLISSTAASSTDLVSTSVLVSSLSSSSVSSLSIDTLLNSISNPASTSTALMAVANDGNPIVSSGSTVWAFSTSSSVSAINLVSVPEFTSSSSSTFASGSTSASLSSSTYISSVSSTSLKSTATLSTVAAGITTAAATGACVPVTITQIVTTTVTASPDKRRFYGLI